MSKNTPLGNFVWYELLTTEPEAAQTFYGELIGWTTQALDGGPVPYSAWVNNGTPLGGVMQLPDEVKQQGVPPYWIPYVSTPDVDKTLSDAQAAGGRVLMGPMDIKTMGRMATIADPQGAALTVFSPETDVPAKKGQAEIGEFSWHELASTDAAAGFDFYRKLFGWVKTESMDMGEAGLYQMYGQSSELSVGGMFDKPKEMPVSAWVIYIRVDSVDDRAEQVKELGGQVINGPMDVPGGDRIAQCLDPQGAMFALHSTKPAA